MTIPHFLQGVPAATIRRLPAVLNDPQQKALLPQSWLSLAATVDVGEPLLKPPNILLALDCCDVISIVQSLICNEHHLNVAVVARELSTVVLSQESSTSVLNSVHGSLSMVYLQHSDTDMDSLLLISVVTDLMLGHLKGELLEYTANRFLMLSSELETLLLYLTGNLSCTKHF